VQSHPVVRSVTVQTMTFTGHGGKNFRPRQPMPLDGAAHAIETATSGLMRRGDSSPTPARIRSATASPLSEGWGRLHSLTGFFTVEELRQMLGHGYLLQPGEHSHELFQRAIDRLWADGDAENLLPRSAAWWSGCTRRAAP